jgi:inosose dehydratase
MILREPPLASRPPMLRRPCDALGTCPIGTVPILWNNVDLADLRAATSADVILDEIARVGYDGTQSGGGFPEGDKLQRALRERDLRLAEVYASIPCTVDGPSADALDLTRRRLSLLHHGGGEVLVVALDVSPGRIETAGRADAPDVPRLTDRGWARVADLVSTLADEAKALGHPVAWHQHAGTFVETPAELDRLLGLVDADRLGICLDVGHYLVGGGDPVEAIRRYGRRIVHVHLKDVDPRVLGALRSAELGGFLDAIRGRLFTELGAGILELRSVLAALVRVGYGGWLMVEQDSCWGPPSEAAAIGRRVLAQELRGLGATQAT